MAIDHLFHLDEAIASAARDRDLKKQKGDNEQAAKVRQREAAIAIWAERKAELPKIVEKIDRKLKEHDFPGIALGTYEFKHSDIARVVIEFMHSPHHVSKILFCVTTAGEFTCSIGAVTGYAVTAKGPIAEVTAARFEEVLSQAVIECLNGSPASFQGAQSRNTHVLNVKLDELTRALEGVRTSFDRLSQMSNAELDDVKRRLGELVGRLDAVADDELPNIQREIERRTQPPRLSS